MIQAIVSFFVGGSRKLAALALALAAMFMAFVQAYGPVVGVMAFIAMLFTAIEAHAQLNAITVPADLEVDTFATNLLTTASPLILAVVGLAIIIALVVAGKRLVFRGAGRLAR